MYETEVFSGRGYEIVAFAHGQKPVYYEEFTGISSWDHGYRPDQFGAWLLLARSEAAFYVYQGERHPEALSHLWSPLGLPFTKRRVIAKAQALEFVQKVRYDLLVVTIPIGTLQALCEERSLAKELGRFRNRPELWGLPKRNQAARIITTAVKLEMGWPLVVDDVLGARNQELTSRALRVFGSERFIRETGAQVLDSEGGNELLRVRRAGAGSMLYVHVVDASTRRRYLLRVPPNMRTVRQAIAWTFGFDNPDDYHPLVER